MGKRELLRPHRAVVGAQVPEDREARALVPLVCRGGGVHLGHSWGRQLRRRGLRFGHRAGALALVSVPRLLVPRLSHPWRSSRATSNDDLHVTLVPVGPAARRARPDDPRVAVAARSRGAGVVVVGAPLGDWHANDEDLAGVSRQALAARPAAVDEAPAAQEEQRPPLGERALARARTAAQPAETHGDKPAAGAHQQMEEMAGTTRKTMTPARTPDEEAEVLVDQSKAV